MTLAAVAWDIDGTLVDSEPRHHRALVKASRDWRVDLSDLPDQAFRGIHMGDVWTGLRARFPASLAFEDWLAAINRAYVADSDDVVAIPGARETIQALADAGIPQICVSNSNRIIVDANIAALGIAAVLAGSISLDDVRAGKPDPEPYLKGCELLGCAPRSVLAVEDSPTGLQSARRAGLFAVGFSIDAAASAEADLVIDDLRRVLTVVTDSRQRPISAAR